MALVLTSKYQKKLTKVTKVVDILTFPIAVFETSVSKALNNGEIDKQEFSMLQEIHLKVTNNLANVDSKMETEMRTQLQKNLLEEINDIKKTITTRMPNDLLTISCLLSSVLPQWISSKISIIKLIAFGKAIKPSRS